MGGMARSSSGQRSARAMIAVDRKALPSREYLTLSARGVKGVSGCAKRPRCLYLCVRSLVLIYPGFERRVIQSRRYPSSSGRIDLMRHYFACITIE